MLRVGRATGGRGVLILLLALLVALPVDAIVHDLAFRYVVAHEVRLLSNGFTHLGTAWASSGLLGALAVVAYRTTDVRLLRASLGGLVGVGLGSLVSHVTKQVTCRGRPGLLDGWGVAAPVSTGSRASERAAAWRFFHWPCLTDARYQSFPSGHATAAFALAAALVRAVPSRRRVWLAIAAGVGASRVLLNAHFLSDVLGGAVIGWEATQAGWVLAQRIAPLVVEPGPLPAPIDPSPPAGVPSV